MDSMRWHRGPRAAMRRDLDQSTELAPTWSGQRHPPAHGSKRCRGRIPQPTLAQRAQLGSNTAYQPQTRRSLLAKASSAARCLLVVCSSKSLCICRRGPAVRLRPAEPVPKRPGQIIDMFVLFLDCVRLGLVKPLNHCSRILATAIGRRRAQPQVAPVSIVIGETCVVISLDAMMAPCTRLRRGGRWERGAVGACGRSRVDAGHRLN